MSLTRVYFSLGSNIEPQKHIRVAVQQIQVDFPETQLSNLYSNPAIGFEGGDFLNLVIAIETEDSLHEMLVYAESLEKSAGRIRVARGRYDSRTLDVDLLMFGQLTGVQEGRTWPNEDLKAAHVLRPIVDIAGEERHPVNGKRFKSLWQEFDQSEVQLTKVNILW